MNKTCELLKKSFFEDEWKEDMFTMVRVKDGLELWTRNSFLSFTGYNNGIHIPLLLRFYMSRQLLKGRNSFATKKYLEKEVANES